MRFILPIFAVLALVWGGYWFYGASRLEDEAVAWFAQASDRGQRATHEGVAVAGFPNRFDLTVTAPEIIDLHSQLGWRAPFIQVFALSYRPNHVIITWPNEQEVVLGAETLALSSARMQASAVFAGMGSRLDRATLVAEALQVVARDWALGLAEAQLSLRSMAARRNSYEFAFNAAEIGSDLLPDTGALVLDGTVALDPANRPQEIVLTNLTLRSGDGELRGEGRLEVAGDGTLTGRIDLRATEWQVFLTQAVELGLIRPEVAPTWENALGMLAQLSGTPDALSVPLAFNRGMMSLGPLPIGPAPRF
ncbi:DUF2125 domain-containing protein [Plastorhodobacter daqingensis]|uniref:DUF2125 domain-containing protein n=1 Tax=Plastorhodobacter daqingensis TaxID=1387281 RepID=A0ABW2UPR1_9RHOB